MAESVKKKKSKQVKILFVKPGPAYGFSYLRGEIVEVPEQLAKAAIEVECAVSYSQKALESFKKNS